MNASPSPGSGVGTLRRDEEHREGLVVYPQVVFKRNGQGTLFMATENIIMTAVKGGVVARKPMNKFG